MCLIAFAWHQHKKYPLALCANRDEFYDRPTMQAHFWEDHPKVFAGRDLQAGGTWLGVNTRGRFAALTNVRDPQKHDSGARSRGLLVSRFLSSDVGVWEYCETLRREGDLYNGFNLLLGEGSKLVYFSNRLSLDVELEPGVYSLSNAYLNTPWPKTLSSTKQLEGWMRHPGSVSDLARLLDDREMAMDHELPVTGVSRELEKALSSQFIHMENYGTRCSTGLLVHRSGDAEFLEQNFLMEIRRRLGIRPSRGFGADSLVSLECKLDTGASLRAGVKRADTDNLLTGILLGFDQHPRPALGDDFQVFSILLLKA
jgi:uncharacterized protein with NRDE domain